MAVMVPVVIMAIRGVACCKTIVIDSIGMMMIMVVIVKVESRYRSFVAQMTMQALRRRPSELERNDEQEKDGYEATHRRIVPDVFRGWMADFKCVGFSERLINEMTPFDYYDCYAAETCRSRIALARVRKGSNTVRCRPMCNASVLQSGTAIRIVI